MAVLDGHFNRWKCYFRRFLVLFSTVSTVENNQISCSGSLCLKSCYYFSSIISCPIYRYIGIASLFVCQFLFRIYFCLILLCIVFFLQKRIHWFIPFLDTLKFKLKVQDIGSWCRSEPLFKSVPNFSWASNTNKKWKHLWSESWIYQGKGCLILDHYKKFGYFQRLKPLKKVLKTVENTIFDG